MIRDKCVFGRERVVAWVALMLMRMRASAGVRRSRFSSLQHSFPPLHGIHSRYLGELRNFLLLSFFP